MEYQPPNNNEQQIIEWPIELKVIMGILVGGIFIAIIVGIYLCNTIPKSPSSSSSSSYDSTKETCKYKINGRYVCSDPATNGNLCYRHFKELDDTYKYFTGE